MRERIVVGERGEQLRELQVLSLTLADAAARLSKGDSTLCANRMTPALLKAGARSLALWSCAGFDTPLEVLALATRNVFEVWLRLLHVLSSQANCQQWRDENLTDQLQVYEAVLSLQGPSEAKDVVRGEMERVAALAAARGIARAKRPLQARELDTEVDQVEEYTAFYKLYSKLVHPSSWLVNSPDAVGQPMYADVLAVSSQVYAWRMLNAVEAHFGVSLDESLSNAERRLGTALPGAGEWH